MTYSKKQKAYIAFSAIFAFGIMLTIFILSAQDGTDSSETSNNFVLWLQSLLHINLREDVIRTLAHFCEFAALGFSVSNLWYAVKGRAKPLICIAFSWGYAWTDEIHQIFVAGRAFQLIDLTVDLGGIILGSLIYFAIIKLCCRKQ